MLFPAFEAYGFAGLGEIPANRWMALGNSAVSIEWEIIIYAATHEYITRESDTLSGISFIGTLEKAFRTDRSVIGQSRIGEAITIGLGEVTINNSEGDYDFLTVDHTVQGQKILIRYGDRTRPYLEWRDVISGFMVDMNIDRYTVVFSVRDGGYLLDVPSSPNVYAGTGDIEGTSDLKNKRKPRWFGTVLNVHPPLVIPSSLAYQLNDGPIQAVNAVYVRGVAQVPHSPPDLGTVAAMNAVVLGIGEYATCLTAGWMRIGVAANTELGEVTCDFSGDKAGGVFVETAADIVRRLLGVTEFVDPTDLSANSFADLNAAQPAPIGYGIAAGSDELVSASVSAIMASIGGWGGASRYGMFEVQRFTAPSGVPTRSYSKLNVKEVKIAPMPTDLSPPPPWRVRVGYERNWTPGQTNLAGAVSDTRRAYLAQELRFASADNIIIKVDFPPGHELVEDKTYFRDLADAQAEAARKLALYGRARALYVITLSYMLFVHDIGDVISIDFPRFDLDGGKLLRIVKITEDSQEGVEITAFG